MCLSVISQWDSGFYFESRLAECAIVGVYGYFLFSEAFLSREATARGTPREKST